MKFFHLYVLWDNTGKSFKTNWEFCGKIRSNGTVVLYKAGKTWRFESCSVVEN